MQASIEVSELVAIFNRMVFAERRVEEFAKAYEEQTQELKRTQLEYRAYRENVAAKEKGASTEEKEVEKKHKPEED